LCFQLGGFWVGRINIDAEGGRGCRGEAGFDGIDGFPRKFVDAIDYVVEEGLGSLVTDRGEREERERRRG
jgi:hypothetical protein